MPCPHYCEYDESDLHRALEDRDKEITLLNQRIKELEILVLTLFANADHIELR